jgi:hypothetical protein
LHDVDSVDPPLSNTLHIVETVPDSYKKRNGAYVPFLFFEIQSISYILFNSGTMRRETMLMILIIGLTAGPAVSL